MAERHYKGIDIYAEIAVLAKSTHPDLSERLVFVLAGKGNPIDVAEMEARGLKVFSNIPDTDLIELYTAADVYMNFSQWEGYNLGIGQALALGLPVIASDIPAHREFPITTAINLDEAISMLSDLVAIAGEKKGPRHSVISDWNGPLQQFAAAIAELCGCGVD